MVGIDIVDVSRVAALQERYGEKFLRKVYTEGEVLHGKTRRRSSETMAGKFAAKEAFMKAFGRRVPWRAVEVVSAGGRPYILYEGDKFGDVSISHEREYAVAVVIIGKENEPDL
jgi:holo-[acyl-carrier protein] synthase